MTRRCATCGDYFNATEKWQRRCWSCWRHKRDDQERQDAYDSGYLAGYAAAQRRATAHPTTPQLDSDLIRDLIALCHPDRHPNERAEQANRATARLIELRTVP
jgi:predicted  nucleic acid-binding Zn-ribbon protein